MQAPLSTRGYRRVTTPAPAPAPAPARATPRRRPPDQALPGGVGARGSGRHPLTGDGRDLAAGDRRVQPEKVLDVVLEGVVLDGPPAGGIAEALPGTGVAPQPLHALPERWFK